MKKIYSFFIFFIGFSVANAQNPSSTNLNLSASLLPFFIFSLLTMAALYLFVLFIIKKQKSGFWVYILSVLAMAAGLFLTYQLQSSEEKQSFLDNNISINPEQPKQSNNVIHTEFYVVNMSNIIICLVTAAIDFRRRKTNKIIN
jgi:hypothetical protein